MVYGRAFTNRLLVPSLVFPTISAIAVYIIFGHAYQSGTARKLAAQCASPSASPYVLQYTGIQVVDYQLCGLVACFHALLVPSNLPFNVTLLSGLAPLAVIPVIEGARLRRHGLLETHVVIALIYQRATAAVMLPWYWLIFVTTGAASRSRDRGAEIDQAHAEAILFSLIVGYVVPSVGMLTMNNPWITAIWQPFPLWMFLAQHVYLIIRSRNPQSGYRTIQATYILLFLLSAIPHIYFLWPTLVAGDHARFTTLFVPSLVAPDSSSTAQAGVLDFIQWDIIIVLLSTFLASLWIAKSIPQFFMIIVWFVAAGVVLGPGSALVGVFAWREGLLNASVDGEVAGKGGG